MVYDSLLLNYGGGIIGDVSKSAQFTGSATLAIGIGGTGVAALSELKGKIYQQLHPDNPGDAVPRYDGIQLLAIDSDDGDFQKYRGNCRLRTDEFFSICNPQLAAALKNKKQIHDDPLLNWMEIDNISQMMAPEGAGGIRQVGRYLLMSKAASLETVIQSKCALAMQSRGTHSLDIYIFAGISGGTGSGCFLDTCYMVRQIAKNNGWNAKIMGYFFLPDVVTSKPEVAKNPGAVAYNNSNGYAAMKELDYLSNLKDANDVFTQKYSSTLIVDTDEPPVDMCHLVSSYKSDGTMVPNGFTYGINVASDYVMSYLADVQMDGGGNGADNGMTMRGHQANVAQGVAQLAKNYGANLNYHIMGACNAEIPMSQINTYLACGFYAKFMKAIGRQVVTVGKPVVVKFSQELKLTADDMLERITMNAPMLCLPEIDRKVLARSARPAPGYLPEEWAVSGNDWLNQCEGVITANINGLLMKLDTYDYNKITNHSLSGGVFRKLWELSVDPNVGPYFAAMILHNGSHDLTTEIDGAIETTEQRLSTEEMYFRDAKKNLESCKDNFYSRNPSKNAYAAYENAALTWYRHNFNIQLMTRCADTLRKFKKLITDLYGNYFKPLVEMLDNLRETFEENQTYLSLPVANAANAYTWQILTFSDIKKTLDERIEALSAKELVTDFVSNLLFNSEAWINGDQDKIAMQIRHQMLELFKQESARSLQDYLQQKYPQATDAQSLADEVRKDIITRVHSSAIPMFWRDPTFNGQTFDNCNMSVPANTIAVCTAAEDFCKMNNFANYTVRKTGIGDRIFALRLCSGVPLFAYQGITLLKTYYDAAEGKAAGAGSHLYAKTGRGTDGSGHKDWRHFLPTPMPYSKLPEMTPDGDKLSKLYDDAVAVGIIAQTEDGKYILNVTPEFAPKTYTAADFMDGDRFSKPMYDKELAELEALYRDLYVDCQTVNIRNDGATTDQVVVDRCRKDYFIYYRKLQALAREELAKRANIEAALASLKQVYADYTAYDADVNRFCNLVFYKNLVCENASEQLDCKKIAKIYCTYIDSREDKRTQEFSVRGSDSMPFGKDFPLYQAFLTYRKLDVKKSPRKELDEAAGENERKKLVKEDLMIAAWLEQLWTTDAMDSLKEEVSVMSTHVAADIVRFYESLRSAIRELKDNAPVWPTTEELEQFKKGEDTTVVTPPAPPVPPTTWNLWDPATQKQLVVYSQYGANLAYDQSTGQWMSVTASMMVWNGAAWVPLKTDPFFANI